jgi:hypothetical protein
MPNDLQIDLAPLVLARLRACLTGFVAIEGAAELDAAMAAAAPGTPAAYVLPLAMGAGELLYASQYHQRLDTMVGVVLCCSNASDARGEAAMTDLTGLRRQVILALCGWAPWAGEMVAMDGGAIIGLKDGCLWWRDDFRAVSDLRVGA